MEKTQNRTRLTGEAPLPAARLLQKTRLSGFQGIDRRGGVRQGYLLYGEGLDPRALPALESLPTPAVVAEGLAGDTLALAVIGDRVYRVYVEGRSVFLARREEDGRETRVVLPDGAPSLQRTLLPFHLYDKPEDPLTGSFRRMLLVLPDAVMLDTEDTELRTEVMRGTGSMPTLHHACVHLSRLFGAREDRLFASAFNNPRNWQLDTASDIDGSHAWASAVQSNTRASGDFTALTVYDGHVLAFKRGFCHVLNNNKNPFRVADLLTVGTQDGRTVAEVEGKLFFVAADGVYCYNGANATRISDELGVTDFSGALATAADGMYLLYLPAERTVFLYAPRTGGWTSLAPCSSPLTALATGEGGCYMTDAAGRLLHFAAGAHEGLAAESTPLLDEYLHRVCRVSVTATGEAGAEFALILRDTGGRETMLWYGMLAGGTQQIVSRAFTPADYGGTLCLCGSGRLRLDTPIITTTRAEKEK